MDELRDKLITACNESNVSLEAMVYVVKDVYREVIDAYNQSKRAAAQAQEATPVEAEVVEE